MPTHFKSLPEKYYLDHFNEFIDFICSQCGHLLDQTHLNFVNSYQQLPHNAQCMFVRVINRQSRFINQEKMQYSEILNCPKQLELLEKVRLLRRLSVNDIDSWLTSLTKVQLCEILSDCQVLASKKNADKAMILETVLLSCTSSQCLASKITSHFHVKNFEQNLAYLLFLFFGNTHSGLDKFSLRDMGVLKTRKDHTAPIARFDDIQQAKAVFHYSFKIGQLKRNELDMQSLSTKSIQIEQPKGIVNCFQSEPLKNEYYFLLGKALLNENHSLALEYFKNSSYAGAQQKWLRELYKIGEKQQVKDELEHIIDHSLDDALLLFAEDFYHRKYHKVKLSKLTQKLREDSYQLMVDQIYRNQVEQGVQQYFQRKGATVYRTENHLFNALFALTFWDELFQLKVDSTANEFDRRPKAVKENNVYRELQQEIEQRLLIFSTPISAIVHITKIATLNYGQPNGMFSWEPNIIELISHFIRSAPKQAIVNQLRAMAENFQGLNDGYPDLMIVENGVVRFEEVKAPGDAIRPNQFITINTLQSAGFDVRICRVEWYADPMQPYVVIDVETTGGKQPQHRITEIGAVKMINGEIVDSWSSLINPQRHIPRFITQLTGIDNEMVKDAPLFSEIADSLQKFLRGSVFVAHNVNFDYGFFKQEFQRLEQKFSMPKLCTIREMRKHYPELKSYSLGNLCERYNIPLHSHHRALCDAEATAELLKLTQQRSIEH